MAPDAQAISQHMMDLQDSICNQLSSYDGTLFQEDPWTRPGGGGGRTRVIGGQKIEKGGVNFSAVEGVLGEVAARALGIAPGVFFATGVSIVLHPHNPLVPIIHMNVRYFESGSGDWWFGGGIDLTPHYIVADDARYFHSQLKKVCDQYDKTFYPRFKEWADDYFFIKHRHETRGVGGIFYDRLGIDSGYDKQFLLDYSMAVGGIFAPTYIGIASRHVHKPFTPHQQEWQFLRRGRYAEFNLAIDRGTRFGLETDGRTESILMSLPPKAIWRYDYQPAAGSDEAATQALLSKDIDWLA
jgi:coproporphyrinogen III oxidase